MISLDTFNIPEAADGVWFLVTTLFSLLRTA